MDFFTLQIQTIKEMLDWRVSLDIILIATIIFFLYRTLKATGTWKIVAGIMVAGVMFLIARLLGLKGIEWIYSNVSPILLLTIIILFQPELRKIFERAASIRRKEIGSEGTKLSFVIGDVVFALANKKRGALIVFPGKESIKAWTSEGIPLDATPSFPILMSIFDPNSPGHDGAVVIENGKILSFGVKLPLSESDKLSDEFGTRHHAGLGLSEVTDALVIAVSEERGTVTLFHEGIIEKIKDKNELPAKILTHWKNTASYQLFNQNEQNRGKVTKQIITSFLLAFLFWSTVVLTQIELKEMSCFVPVEYVAKPKNFTIVGEKANEIKLDLLGTATDINNVNPTQLRVTVSLETILPGENEIVVNEEMINLPQHVKIIEARPRILELNAVELKEIDAIVKPQLIGAIPTGFEIVNIKVNPEFVKVLAPVDEVQNIEVFLLTTPIYLENIRQNMKLFCSLVMPQNLQLIENSLLTVEVNFEIRAND